MEFSETFYKFIKDHQDSDPHNLIIRRGGVGLSDEEYREAVLQIECRRRTRHKLSTIVGNEEFLFPDTLSSEQASDERIAEFHSTLLSGGESVLDMTAGLGIDAMALSGKASEVTAIEIDERKARFLRHNAELRGLKNFTIINGDSIEYLRNTQSEYDIIYIDPARRKTDNSRAYGFRDCEPDITENLPLMLKHGANIFVKSSPMLDIKETIREFPTMHTLYIVSLKGECKEILLGIGRERTKLKIVAMDLEKGIRYELEESDLWNNEDVSLTSEDETFEGRYLYEPNASIMKCGCWRNLSERYPGLKKLSKNTHLFMHEEVLKDFPGRALRIEKILNKQALKGMKGERINVTTRNYICRPEELKKRYGIKDGGEKFIYGAKYGAKERPLLLKCQPITNI